MMGMTTVSDDFFARIEEYIHVHTCIYIQPEHAEYDIKGMKYERRLACMSEF